jgi:hypothetical protein
VGAPNNTIKSQKAKKIKTKKQTTKILTDPNNSKKSRTGDLT